jgi:hypothetical protein
VVGVDVALFVCVGVLVGVLVGVGVLKAFVIVANGVFVGVGDNRGG